MKLELEPNILNKKSCICNVQTIQFLNQALKESGIYYALELNAVSIKFVYCFLLFSDFVAGRGTPSRARNWALI